VSDLVRRLPFPGLDAARPWPAQVQAVALALFFVALAVSISASQVLLAVLVVLAWARPGAGAPAPAAPGAPAAGPAHAWRDGRALLGHPLTAPILAYAALSLLSALTSGDAGWSLWIARDVLRTATFFVVLALTRDAAHALRLWQGFLVVLTAMAGYGLVQGYVCRARPPALGEALLAEMCIHPSRVSGPFSIYMTFGGVLLLGTLFLLAYLATMPWRQAWWMAPASVATLVALLLTYSRNAWLGLAAGALTLVLISRRSGRILVALALLAGVAVVAAPAPVAERARSMLDLRDETARDRVAMWRSGLAMIADRPLLGVGPGEVRAWYPQYRRPEAVRPSTGHLHNSAIQIAAERGLPALGVWVWLWVAFFREAWRVLRRLGPADARGRALTCASLAGVTGFLVAGLFEHNFGDSEVAMLVYALMALPFIVARDID
jgi:putative inorganic carbon (HCO3(-)) transporter